VSDDIPIIFAEDLLNPDRKAPPAAVFLSAASLTQMQQYATAGWRVLAAPGFKSSAEINLTGVPAAPCGEEAAAGAALLSCEAPFLNADTGGRVGRWKPAIVKFNCAFHNVADAASLASSLKGMGYTVLGAHWRDDNSFAIRSLTSITHISAFAAPEWDRMNLIGVRDPDRARALISLAHLYVGEEKRIAELRVANAIRNDHIARLEDALIAHQTSDVFRLQRS
jgi:hypothetical protein